MNNDQGKKNTGIWNSVFVHVFVTNMLLHLCIYMMNTLSATYADYLGAASMLVGLVSGLFAATALVFKILSAPTIDTFNRKYVLMGASGILLLSFLGYAVSNNIPMLIISRLLTGAGMAFTSTCCLTVASDSLPQERMASGIGYFALGSALAQALAPTIGLNLVNLLGYNKTFACLAGITLLVILYLNTMKLDFVKTKKFQISLNGIIAKSAIKPAAIQALMNMTYSCINSFLVLYAVSRGVDSGKIGIYFTVYAVTMLFSRPLIGNMADRIGTVKTLIPCMIAFAGSFLLISVSSTLPMFLAASFLSAFGYGGCFPTIQAVCMKSVPKERRGAASTTAYVGTDITNLIGPVIAGFIVEHMGGYVPMWRWMLIPVGISFLLTLAWKRGLENPEEKATV